MLELQQRHFLHCIHHFCPKLWFFLPTPKLISSAQTPNQPRADWNPDWGTSPTVGQKGGLQHLNANTLEVGHCRLKAWHIKKAWIKINRCSEIINTTMCVSQVKLLPPSLPPSQHQMKNKYNNHYNNNTVSLPSELCMCSWSRHIVWASAVFTQSNYLR